MPTLTIAAAARLCGCPRSTLQRAIHAGRLHLDANHQLDTDELSRAGYLSATAAQQEHAAAARQPPFALSEVLRDMQRSIERLSDILEAFMSSLPQMQQPRSRSVQQPRSRSTPPALQPRQPQAPPGGAPYDTTRYILGRLCPRGHEYQQTGQTLRLILGRKCRECEIEGQRERRRVTRERLTHGPE
jgi:hypothetical protein